MAITDSSERTTDGGFATDLRSFLSDFAAFAGRKGLVVATFLLLGALLEGFSLVMLVPLLAIVTGTDLPPGRFAHAAAAVFDFFGVENPLGRLTLVLAAFGALLIVRAVVLYVRDIAVVRLRTAFIETHRLRIIERLAAAPWEQIARLRHARVTQLMSGELQRMGMAASLVLQIATAGTMVLAQCVITLLLAPALALVALAMLALGGIASSRIAHRAHAMGSAATQSNLLLLNSVAQFLGGLKLAISQNLQSGFLAELRENLREQAQQQIGFVRQQIASRLAVSTLATIAGAVLVLVGFGALHVTPATMIALLLIIGRMVGPASNIQQNIQQVAHALPVYRRVKALERELTEIRQPAGDLGDVPKAVEGPIVFQNVGYRHHLAHGEPDAPRGVCKVDFTLRPGEMVGIAGPTGAGKTTFADLLVGLYPPEEGKITVAGQALHGGMVAAWRNRVSYISQDSFMFHDTVRRNLAWAAPKASEPEMWCALDLAGAGDLVRGMERGLDTVLGERGALVSGGERQRLALARALLRKPSLLVLDEATSAIDIVSERSLLNSLRRLEPRPTIVIVAHRSESLAFCDRVLRFEGGHCVEDKVALRV